MELMPGSIVTVMNPNLRENISNQDMELTFVGDTNA